MTPKSLLPFLLFALTACSNNGPVQLIKFSGMKGNVKMVKEFVYGATEKFGEVVPGELDDVYIYEYDKKGNQTVYSAYNDEGVCTYKMESIFDDRVLESQIIYVKATDSKTENRVIERGEDYCKWLCDIGTDEQYTMTVYYNGEFTKSVDADGNVLTDIAYDSKGRLIDQMLYSDGELFYRLFQKFDKDNNVIKVTNFIPDGGEMVMTFSYPEYDKKGNWITQYTWIDGEVTNVTKREITYR